MQEKNWQESKKKRSCSRRKKKEEKGEKWQWQGEIIWRIEKEVAIPVTRDGEKGDARMRDQDTPLEPAGLEVLQ